MLSKETVERIARAREEGEFTDFAFVCDGHYIPVHRIIVCTQSRVFRAACLGPFAEAKTKEYKMNEHPISIVRLMVDYLYNGDYKEEVQVPDMDSNPATLPVLSLHAVMYSLADEYDILGLRTIAAKNYSTALKRISSVQEFLDSIPDVYSTPGHARGIRDVAISFAREKLPKHLMSTEAKTKFDELVIDNPEFMKELLDSFLREPLMGYCSICGFSKPVPIEVLQCRCTRCGKGGASTTRRGSMFLQGPEERYIGV